MKISNQKRIFGLSLVTAMLLGSSAYAGMIVGADAKDDYIGTVPPTQFSFGGWDLANVAVKITDTDYIAILKDFYADGSYDAMTYGDSFESDIKNTSGDIMAHLHGKDWPVGEPTGIKIVNGDKYNKGKPGNCIMTTSYLDESDNPAGVNGYLDSATPAPTICSSAFQTHKRFKVNMLPSTVDGVALGAYGKPIDLVFNLVEGDISALRYQVLQKINNYTGMRLDGYKIEVLKADGLADNNLTLSIGLNEGDQDGDMTPDGDIWDAEEMANYSHGLWGPIDDHFPTNGFFDSKRAGFMVSGHSSPTLTGGPTTLGSNYPALFGLWLPSKWQPIGIFHDDDNDPLTDAALMAFWGDPLNTGTNAWHKGKDYDLSNGDQSWSVPTDKELITWTIDPLYAIGHIEDTLNLGLNYIVNVGDNTQIGNITDGYKFTIRITPRVATIQTRPSYIEDDNVTYIEPPTSYVATAGIVTISPNPTFTPGTSLYVGIADSDLNNDAALKETVTITVTSDTGDSESITLTETDVDSGVFSATLATENSTSAPVANNGIMTTIEDTVVTATYVDTHYGDTGLVETLTASTIAKTPVIDDGNDAVDSEGEPASSGGGGGCTYNPNSKSFDMMFLFIAALGLLFPFRRRFLK